MIMGNFLSSLEKDKPLYALTVGEFQMLMSELMPVMGDEKQNVIENSSASDQMNIKQCAAYLNVSQSTLHRYKNNGVLPFYKASRTVFFKKNEVDQALSSEPKKKGNKI